MKKLLAILLALLMILVSVTAALAAEVDPEEDLNQISTRADSKPPEYEQGNVNFNEQNPLQGNSFTVDKKYTLTVGTNAKLPVDVITYTAVLKSITDSTVSYTDESQLPVTISAAALNTDLATNYVATGDSVTFDERLTITLPDYTAVGIYKYLVTETGTNVAGVTYTDNSVYMTVTVVNKDPKDLSKGIQVAGIAFHKNVDGSDKKLGFLSNDYKAGTLKVTKSVTGNGGEIDRDFTFTITLTSTLNVTSKITYATTGKGAVTAVTGATGATAPTLDKTNKAIEAGTGWTSATITVTLRDTDTVTFYNIPDGVKYTVEETQVTGYDKPTGEVKNATAITPGDSTNDQITVVNNKNIPVDTGVALDTVPYIMILALVMIGAAMVLIRKREEY